MRIRDISEMCSKPCDSTNRISKQIARLCSLLVERNGPLPSARNISLKHLKARNWFLSSTFKNGYITKKERYHEKSILEPVSMDFNGTVPSDVLHRVFSCRRKCPNMGKAPRRGSARPLEVGKATEIGRFFRVPKYRLESTN